MRRSGRASDVGTVVVAVLVLVLAALAFRAGGGVLIGFALLVVVVAAAVILRVDLIRAGLYATCGFVFTCGWTGWYVAGHQRPRALFLLLALLLTVAAHVRSHIPKLPWWYFAMVGSVLLDGILDVVLPTSQRYLDGRYIEIPGGSFGLGIGTGLTDFGTMARMLLTLVGAVVTIVICSMHFKRAPFWIAVAYAAGASLSSWVAFVDGFVHTQFGQILTGVGVINGRAAGFTNHSNLQAACNVYAIAIAAWLAAGYELKLRIAGLVMTAGLLGGTFATRSRGGAICIAVAAVLCLVILPRYRRRLPFYLAGIGMLVTLLFVAKPDLGQAVLSKLRLAGNAGPSDLGRSAVLKQGLRDFGHRPIQGIGLHVVDEAHNILVQALASGGLIFLFGFMALQIGSAWSAYRLLGYDELAAPLLATVLAGFAFGNLENTLSEPLVYVPVALVIALGVQRAMSPPDSDSADEGSAGSRAAPLPPTRWAASTVPG